MNFLPPQDPSASLAWANRQYAPLNGRSCEGAGSQAREALEAYRAVGRRYPKEPRAHVGAARSLFRLGLYRASVAEYRASGSAPQELATALDFARTAERVQRNLPRGQTVRHLLRRSRSEWVALTSRQVREDEAVTLHYDLYLRSYRFTVKEFAAVGNPVKVVLGRDDCRDVAVFSSPKVPDHFFIQTAYMAASSLPNAVRIVKVNGLKLKVGPSLRSLGTTQIRPDHGGAWILVTPTYKVWWTDTYRLEHGRISFATHRRPDLYRDIYEPPTGSDRRAYHAWMRYASQLTIQRRRSAAIEAWREAERCARASVRERATGTPGYLAFHPDYGMFGETRVNLREIRQRIAWLRRNDWGHWLLYRPYDWGLQVPPYRLGNSMPPEDHLEW